MTAPIEPEFRPMTRLQIADFLFQRGACTVYVEGAGVDASGVRTRDGIAAVILWQQNGAAMKSYAGEFTLEPISDEALLKHAERLVAWEEDRLMREASDRGINDAVQRGDHHRFAA